MDKSVSVNLEEKTEVQTQKTVRCKNCAHEITKRSFAMEPHEHTFRNPFGYSFHVLSYREAPGAIKVGEPTAMASWFPNYEWIFAICGQCQNHIGWFYIGKDQFAGLIATRLIRD